MTIKNHVRDLRYDLEIELILLNLKLKTIDYLIMILNFYSTIMNCRHYSIKMAVVRSGASRAGYNKDLIF